MSTRAEINALWNVFIVVTLGLVGLALGQKTPATRRLKLIIIGAFVVFTVGNLFALLTDQGFALSLLARLRDSSFSGPLADSFIQLPMSPPWRVVVYHVLLDVTVVAAVWGRATAPRTS